MKVGGAVLTQGYCRGKEGGILGKNGSGGVMEASWNSSGDMYGDPGNSLAG